MTPFNQNGWFSLSGGEECHLHYGNRAEGVIREMTRPDTQYPSTVVFLGRRSKDVALRQFFPHNNIGRKGRGDGIVNLRLDSSTISSDVPLLIADGDPLCAIPPRVGNPQCHHGRTLPLAWELSPPHSVLRTLYARFVSLFADVVCIFADDVGGLRGVADLLVAWIRLGSPSDLPLAIRPRVIILASDDEGSVTHDVLALEHLQVTLQREGPGARAAVFSSISVMHLTGDPISPLARHREVKEVWLRELDASRTGRIQQRMLFSAVHFAAFVGHAIDHVAQSMTAPFRFISSTRAHHPIDDRYTRHVSTFLKLGLTYRAPHDALISFLASSIILDAYPPRMHKFDPVAVFRELYRDHCASALTETFESEGLAEHLCDALERQMDSLFTAVDLGFETSTQLHRHTARSLSAQLMPFKSNQTCLFCVGRSPEHPLTCGHAVCDACMMRFGSRVARKEHRYEISRCILCVTRGTVVAQLKPNTAGARVLAVDGGGPRGVVPLEYLRRFQRALGPNLPVQDLFEQAFGTSSGGLIVIGLFLKDWDVPKCTHMFDTLVREFFGMHLTSGRGLLPKLRDYFRCWLSDGRYDVAALEQTLKEVFGADRRMFDAHQSRVSGSKVAVTATTISDAFTYVFSNYNGSGARSRASGYKHVRPEKIEDEPFLWEAGRVTSAAPGLFKPGQIESLGSFQDGGLRHNNPMDLALWECQKIWESPTLPDVVLSLGTGTEGEPKTPKAPHFRHVVNDGFIPRLCRWAMSSQDGEQAWRDSMNRLDDRAKADYFRFNVPFPGDPPRLDDVEQMDALRRSVSLQPTGGKDQTRIITALLAASFFFQLDRRPDEEAGQLLCRGLIRCRNSPHNVIQTLSDLHGGKLEFTTDTESLGPLSTDDVCGDCHLYRKRVCFVVRRREDDVSLHLRFDGSDGRGRRKISGVPHSVGWFVERQRLDSDFGTVDHDVASDMGCRSCEVYSTREASSEKKRKAGEPTACTKSARKKPRLRLDFAR